jgi:hypothetical protein
METKHQVIQKGGLHKTTKLHQLYHFQFKASYILQTTEKKKSCKCTKVLPAIGLNNNCHDKLIILELKILKVKIKSTDVMSWYEYLLVQIHVMSTNIPQIEMTWFSLIYISPFTKKQYTPNSKNSFKFYEAKDVQQKIYRKRMKNPGIWCHVSWEFPYPSLKTFKKKKRVSNNNSCDSLRIHDNSTTNSCEEALKTIYLGN